MLTLAAALTSGRGIHFVDFFLSVSRGRADTPLYFGRIPPKLMRGRRGVDVHGADGGKPARKERYLVSEVVNVWRLSSSARPHPPNTQNSSERAMHDRRIPCCLLPPLVTSGWTSEPRRVFFRGETVCSFHLFNNYRCWDTKPLDNSHIL